MPDFKSFLAYAPYGPGLMCALFYLADAHNVYGWYTGSKQGDFPAHFFMLDDYYSPHESRFYISIEDDVYGAWGRVTKSGLTPIDPPSPLPDEMMHALEQAQDSFCREWLFYADDPARRDDIAVFAGRDLSVQSVNIRAGRLNKLQVNPAVWSYVGAQCDLNIVNHLRRHWSLDYILDL